MSKPSYTNQFGRIGGRGLRPWLLLPKVIAFSIYIGGLATVLGILIVSRFTLLDIGDPHRTLVLDQVGRLMVFLVVPALLLAILFGVALLLQHPKVFLRMRWMQVKLVSLLILIPSSHFFCETRFMRLRAATDHATSDPASRQLAFGLLIALAGSIWIVILGRLKPRL